MKYGSPEHVDRLVSEIWHAHFINKTKLAERLGVSVSTLRRWRRGEATPSRASVELLERILKDGY